jgi:hypothetical protein
LFVGLPESIGALFEPLVGPLDGVGLSQLRAQIRQHHEEFHEAARDNGLLPLDIASELAKGLEQLLDRFHELDDREQTLVAGAARYFVSDSDARPDLESVLGLDDDLIVFNWVVAEIGHPELKIDL